MDSLSRHPYVRILLAFTLWKSLLLALALATPSPAYDTSTTISVLPPDSNRLAIALTRWDALYFVKVAQRGWAHEQEWAFGWGYVHAVRAVKGLLDTLPFIHTQDATTAYVYSGILLSNSAHLLSSITLYLLTLRLFPTTTTSSSSSSSPQLPLLTALLHIFSPAGLFLAAPYSEALFSLTSFTGMLVYATSSDAWMRGKHVRAVVAVLVAAAWWMLATMVRSNGLLNGVVLLCDFGAALPMLLGGGGGVGKWMAGAARVLALGLGGLLMVAGMLGPQVLAWREYCGASVEVGVLRRPWCERSLPSIYTWVQREYWNVGLLRYWTPGNIPLFLLAAPMLTVLTVSSLWALRLPASSTSATVHPLVRRLALPQLLLAVLALLSYHVQIITRLSSGCAVWYWWLAHAILQDAQSKQQGKEAKEGKEGEGREGRQQEEGVQQGKQKGWLGWTRVVRWMLLYGLVQSVLFAAFLPPA